MRRSLADQIEEELGGRNSVLSRQKRDHVELDRLIGEAESSSGPARAAVVNELCRLVFPHAFAEEAVLWPAIRRRLPDGEKLTLQIEKEHQTINELFTSLETLDVDSEEHHRLFGEIVRWLREDVRDEEDVLLPRLQEVSTPAELVRLGTYWQVVRSTAPTRPHPVVARRPPGNVVAAAPLSALDRMRDRLDAAARGDHGWSSAARSASGALATIAGAVEHVPPLTRGERSATKTGHRGHDAH
ncbi:hemerythrin domain-containing protein [Gordonia sp. zg691]|uniref:Hemerythrin domain-containing protein n=1 Tax=Gordonia jinghuaiqii TaxID=2758710 RepID=A0A7D7LUL2_9ACTN|nr:hemerythrin domain-containing protein [Gordonia jinghuaiqii]MBD0863469.1 hemerythrin domain-containing protein [Gordonia jinghuaiqii]MCR5979200.1 hemerythrin domain-containing protein [Gordonia jinghuaiqii]QMT00995.1 hemerythrin domain-containing protein [Gordonia jinghuaiqii]